MQRYRGIDCDASELPSVECPVGWRVACRTGVASYGSVRRQPSTSRRIVMKKRCAWCGEDPLYVAYHDEEWGVPVHDDRRLFEMLILEGAQAGLSWITILQEAGGLPRGVRRIRRGADRPLRSGDVRAPAGRSRHRAQPAEGRGRGEERPRHSCTSARSSAASTRSSGASWAGARSRTAGGRCASCPPRRRSRTR